jgi:hypothetical protein
MDEPQSDRGVAIIFVLLAMMLLSVLGIALALTTSTERQVSATYGWGAETLYAADAAVERALQELLFVADWNLVLGGVTSTFVDGAPGQRILPGGAVLDLAQATDEMNAAAKPWGANNPFWRLYAYGPLSSLSPSGAVDSKAYVVVWVADDSLETDGQPLIDGDDTDGPNPGAGLLEVLAHAYGPVGTRRIIEATLRHEVPRNRVLSWREVRQSS